LPLSQPATPNVLTEVALKQRLETGSKLIITCNVSPTRKASSWFGVWTMLSDRLRFHQSFFPRDWGRYREPYAGHLDLSKHSIKIGVPARWAGSALPSLPKLRYVLPLLKGMLWIGIHATEPTSTAPDHPPALRAFGAAL